MNLKILLIVTFLILISSVFIYNRLGEQPNYVNMDPEITLDADSLYQIFKDNPVNNLLNKFIHIHGIVTGFDLPFMILNTHLICSPPEGLGFLVEIGENVAIKGRCVSYDDLMFELRIDNAVVIQNPN